MNTEIIVLVISNIVAPIVTGIVTFLQTKKKYYTEVNTTMIDNMKESLEFYKTLSDDNKDRLNEMIEKNSYLEKELSELKSQMLTLTMNICLDLTCKRRIVETLKVTIKSQANRKNKNDTYKNYLRILIRFL